MNVESVELVLSVSRGTPAISPLSLEIEFNTEHFISYTITRLCQTFVVQSRAKDHFPTHQTVVHNSYKDDVLIT